MARPHAVTAISAIAATGTAGLTALYLRLSFTAPVVRWSDSEIDLSLARAPLSALRSTPSGHHPIKPAFILFLKMSLALAGHHDPGRVVVFANTLLWLAAIALAAGLTSRSRGKVAGSVLALVLLAMLRFRDNASAIMSESAAAALLLAIVATIVTLKRIRPRAAVALAAALSVLFWVRPNVGAVAIVVSAILARRKIAVRTAVILVALLVAINVSVRMATRPAPSAAGKSGYDYPIAQGSVDYAWDPLLGPRLQADDSRAVASERLTFARGNWRRMLRSGLSADSGRQWLWRAFHGLLGVDYYDASWSRPYQWIDLISREAGIFIVLAAGALLLTIRRREGERGAAILLIGAIVAQDLVFSSEPRLVAPFVPAIIFLAVRAVPDLSQRRAIVAAGAFAVFVGLCAWQPEVLDWPWGRIEKTGVEIVQEIPKGGLPERSPATLHLRVASPLGVSSAHFMAAIGGLVIYRSDSDPCRIRPDIAIALPDEVLRASRRRALDLAVTSFGSFDAANYLLFPVIPPPWRPEAERTGSEDLSPSTGMISGALDWWAHAGADSIPCPMP